VEGPKLLRTAPRYIVRVPERGEASVPPAAWQILSGQPAFWRLVEGGVLSVSQAKGGRRALGAGCYVGTAWLGDVRVECHEKVPGSLEALLAYATHDAFRIEAVPTGSTELGPLAALLIRQFLRSVRRYATLGRERVYQRHRTRGALVAGKIDVTRSVGLRARGLRHILVFDRNELTHRTDTNRVLLRALREVERVAAVVDLGRADVAACRALAMLFSDCQDAGVLFGPRHAFVAAAERLCDAATQPHTRDALALARTVLAHESFEATPQLEDRLPRTWFLNLENLFQLAVRNVLSDLGGPTFRVRDAGRGAPVFRRPGELRAFPDIVVSEATGAVRAIGDTKYKVWGGSEKPSDIYQLLVHAAAFNAPVGFLIYPHHELSLHDLGDAATGCRVTAVGVDVRRLREDLAATANGLSLFSGTAAVAS